MPPRKVKKKPDQPNSEEQAESSKNYSKTERDLLRQLVQAYKHVVENKKADAVSNQRKTQAWQKVTDEFNAQGQSKRTLRSFKRFWENRKSRTESEYDRVRSSVVATGEGPPEADVSQESRFVHEIVAAQVDPIPNRFDDDGIGAVAPKATPAHHAEPSTSVNASAVVNFDVVANANNGQQPDTAGGANAEDLDIGTNFIGFHKPPEFQRTTKRCRCNFAQEQLLEMERAEHQKRLKLWDKKIDSTRELATVKLEVQNLKKEYWQKKLQEGRESPH